MKNSYQLRRWLAREVLGKELPRKPPEKERRGPARNAKYRAWIRSLPCAGCGTTYSVEAAHTGSDGGMSMKASDYSCIPLCTDCHTQAPYAYHRLGREAFERRFGLDLARLVARLVALWRAGKAAAA